MSKPTKNVTEVVVVVQSLSCVWLFATPMDCSMPGFHGVTRSQTWLSNWTTTTLVTFFVSLRIQVQFSRSVVSDSLRPHESQHARPPCPSPTPGVHSDSCPLSQWCHPAMSSSVVPFSSCPQSLPASESFPMSQLFAWGGQSPGISALASVLPKKSQGWSPSEWTGWISGEYKDAGWGEKFRFYCSHSFVNLHPANA